MLQNNVFRLAMALSESKADKFKTNLYKLIKLCLVDSYPDGLTTGGIIDSIKTNYSLEFSHEEIVESIQKNGKTLICQKDGSDPMKVQYRMSPHEYQKEKTRQTDNIDNYILKFIEFQKSDGNDNLEFEETKKTIYDFLYFTFNSDTKTVLELIDKKRVTDQTEYKVDSSFTPEQARVINNFLNWDNSDKNVFVLNLISACFDYCMLTVKKDTSSFSSVFNGKRFYLDSNIIFRLAGFNNLERQRSIEAFIKKGTSAGIEFCYTNHTRNELETSIAYHVNKLKLVFGRNMPLSKTAMKKMSSRYANLSFYDEYFEWCKTLHNQAGDYDGFKDYLIKKVKKVLIPFKPVVAENFDTTAHDSFIIHADSFRKYKAENYKNTFDGAIKVDINNYYYLIKLNENGQASNFLDIRNYFITADHCLTEWSRAQRPGTVPIFVLPSVWYSVLLKYKGRTNDDYASFCQFLNIRIAPERDIHLEDKNIMLSYVMSLSETAEIKEEIIYDIEARLSSVGEDTIDDPKGFAEKSYQSVIDKKVKKAKEETVHEYEGKLDKQKRAYDSDNERKESERKKQRTAEDAKLKADAQDELLDGIAESKAKWHKGIRITALVLFIGCVLGLIVSIILALIVYNNTSNVFLEWFKDNEVIVFVLFSLFGALSAAVRILIKKTHFLTTDKEHIKKKLKKKYSGQK